MDVKERIQKYLDYKGIKTATLEREVGMSNGYWRKTKSISANIVSDILRVYSDLSEKWVLFGEGMMCCSNVTDEEIYGGSHDKGSEDVKDERIKLLEERIAFLEEQVDFYKNRK